MGKPMWRKLAVSLVIVPVLGLAACSSSGGRAPEPESNSAAGTVATTDRIKIAVITHAPPGDTFWDIIRKGAEEAAAKDNVELQYLGDPDGGRQSQLIEQAIDQGVDGIAVTLAKPDAMAGALKRASDAGISIVSLNAGEDRFKELGAFAHFGSDEKLAGEAAGEKLKAEGIKKPICVIQDQGHVGLEARCAGVKKVVPGTEVLYVQGTDMTQVESTTTAKLQADKQADAIIGLGAPITMTLLKAKATANSEVAVASFDMNSQLVGEITKGNVLFTVDQQPWLQGYMAVDSLWQNKRGGFTIGGGKATLTGPAIIDKAVAENITSFAEEGVR
ncbi:sugar ABC transporter substrate-binding protein [Glutamicibacter sp. M10]|uniref:sugar ABC transporter substrate-binding protein n=1 Tax=Glutamicibacter sp. M10 TaxID=3023076 RepID=UPI0021C679D8|nr:sugar ABC transporter substrate-binding protein [Glutamicibacter sp. M10]UXN32522.1 sugar ABC transporter substrate-binding protein [Glutamicibacter sp. M10]